MIETTERAISIMAETLSKTGYMVIMISDDGTVVEAGGLKLIGVCPSCDRWRDVASGDWVTPIEFLKLNSEIKGTRGICRECLEKTYGPEIEDQTQ